MFISTRKDRFENDLQLREATPVTRTSVGYLNFKHLSILMVMYITMK